MAIGDFFRPKHKHSDSAVRAEAIRNMTDDHVAELRDVAANDPDRGVRKLAIERIGDPDVLLSVSTEQSDSTLAELAKGRALAAWAAKVKSAHVPEGDAL